MLENHAINENLDNFDFKSKGLYNMEEDEYTDDYYFSDWFEFVKNIKKSRMEVELKFLTNSNLIGYNSNLLKMLKFTMIQYEKTISDYNSFGLNFFNVINKKSSRILNSLNYYYKFNYSKLKRIKEGNYYVNSENIVVIIDIRPSKPIISTISKNKCLFNITSGIIYKKLSMKQKKTKKTEKMFNLMLKATFLNLQRRVSFKKCVVHLKGTRSNLFNVLVLINKNFKTKEIYMLYSPHIGYNRFKFRKIKSIKKRLRKRFSRLIKN